MSAPFFGTFGDESRAETADTVPDDDVAPHIGGLPTKTTLKSWSRVSRTNSSPFCHSRGRIGEPVPGSRANSFSTSSRPLHALWPSEDGKSGLSFENCEMVDAANTGDSYSNANLNALWNRPSSQDLVLTYEMCEMLAAFSRLESGETTTDELEDCECAEEV